MSNTPGCTLEATDFSELKSEFDKENADKKSLTITLLSDSEAEAQRKYGVFRLKKFGGRELMGTARTTFLIDPEGKVSKLWDKVKAKDHAREVLKELRKLKK